MGRDYYIVVIKKKLEHEVDNKHCISLNYEPDYDDKHEIQDKLFDTVFNDCRYLDDLDVKHKDDFCQLCRWFLEPACYENEYVVLDYHQIRLPSFRGCYFVEDFIHTCGFAYDYNHEGGCVYKINEENVKDMEEDISKLPSPQRTSDIQQHEQTLQTLKFLKDWCKEDNIEILYFTET